LINFARCLWSIRFSLYLTNPAGDDTRSRFKPNSSASSASNSTRKLSPPNTKPSRRKAARNFCRDSRDNGRNSKRLQSARRSHSQRPRNLTAAEWLVDNYHIVEEQLREIREDLPKSYYHELPKLASGELAGYPRIYAVALALITHTDSRLDTNTLRRFITAYQTRRRSRSANSGPSRSRFVSRWSKTCDAWQSRSQRARRTRRSRQTRRPLLELASLQPPRHPTCQRTLGKRKSFRKRFWSNSCNACANNIPRSCR
jgi:hypothetical protein